MGTDIHAVWQAKKDGKWVDVPSTWEQDRHYLLFAWLADVRNGFGFAGVPTHKPIKPIHDKPRGFPEDFEVDLEEHPMSVEAMDPRRAKWVEKDELLPDGRARMWMGDHTHTWLSVDEILAAERPVTLQRIGVVDRTFYEKWDGKTAPEAWSGMIAGRGIFLVDAPVGGPGTAMLPEGATHVRIRFDMPDGLDYFVDEAKRIKAEHGEARLVFGFDS